MLKTRGIHMVRNTVPNGVVLQVQPTGADGSTAFVDQSPAARPLTALGNAQVDTGQLLFSQPTILLDGAGDFVQALDNADFDFGNGPATWEAWIRPTSSIPAFMGIMGKDDAWFFRFNSGQLQFNHRASTGSVFSEINGTGSTFALNTWYHVYACRRTDGAIAVGDSGVRRGLGGTSTNIIVRGSANVLLGNGAFTGSNNFNGNMIARITKGQALYPDASYIVPTARFPT